MSILMVGDMDSLSSFP